MRTNCPLNNVLMRNRLRQQIQRKTSPCRLTHMRKMTTMYRTPLDSTIHLGFFVDCCTESMSTGAVSACMNYRGCVDIVWLWWGSSTTLHNSLDSNWGSSCANLSHSKNEMEKNARERQQVIRKQIVNMIRVCLCLCVQQRMIRHFFFFINHDLHPALPSRRNESILTFDCPLKRINRC